MKKNIVLLFLSLQICHYIVVAQNIVYKFYDQKGIEITEKDSAFYLQKIEHKDSVYISKMSYYKNRAPFKTASYKDSGLKIKHGPIMEYKNGTLLLLGKYFNNIKVDEWVYFYNNFIPKKIVHYKSDGSFDSIPIAQRFNEQFNYDETLKDINNALSWHNFSDKYPKSIINYTETILEDVIDKLHNARVLQAGFHLLFEIDSLTNELKYITSSQPIEAVFNDITIVESQNIFLLKNNRKGIRYKKLKIMPLKSKFNYDALIAASVQKGKKLFLNLKNSSIQSNKYIVVHYLLKMRYFINY